MSVAATRSAAPQDAPIYILMISLHGLIRSQDLELGANPDTGGQTTYVVELTRALAAHPAVEKVDLLTRLIEDDNLSPDYARLEEPLTDGARIVRLPFGPRRYLRKELLWPHLDHVVDKCLIFLRQQGRLPDLIHTHYADAGYVGQQLSLLLGIPLAHTGHSLGRPKLDRMLASGRSPQTLEKQFNFNRRIDAEENIIKHASLIVTSTRQEIEQQYGMYANFSLSRFRVIPPGTDTSRFSPPRARPIDPRALQQVDKYLAQPDKPLIFTISRPDDRKNLKGLIAAYGNSQALQDGANLLVVAGTRDDIRAMEDRPKKIMTDLLFDIDRYDLWGKIALPKHAAQEDVPEFYRLAAKRRGVFVNPALTEPFGLTLIEAAASGLPFVAPDDGGPRDIVANCRNGVLTDTLDSSAIAQSLLEVLSDRKRWRQRANNGIAGVWRHYSWAAHVEKYMKEVRHLLRREQKQRRRQHASDRQPLAYMPPAGTVLISDIDNTLIGDRRALKRLAGWLERHHNRLAFGIATGRALESAVATLKKHQMRIPDVLITSVGTEIHYGRRLVPDLGWAAHIRHLWRRDALAEAMTKLSGLTLQPEENQRAFKLSYFVHPGRLPTPQEIQNHLRGLNLHAQIIYSHEEFLDVLPIRASKGHAIRYLAYKWRLPLEAFLVAGDSGNDAEMLIGDTRAIVVGNHSPELSALRGRELIYFAREHYAAGIIEGLRHYGLHLDAE